MSDQEKFQAFKERVVRENEEKHGRKSAKNMAMKRWMPQTGKFRYDRGGIRDFKIW